MSRAVISGLLILAAVVCAAVGSFMIYVPAGWITIGAGCAYMAWAMSREEATP